MPYNHRGDPIADNHRPTPRMSQLNAGMQARQDSYGESGEYETEANYAESAKGSPEPIDIFKSPRNPRVRQAITNEILSSGRHAGDMREASNEAANLMNTQRTGDIGLGNSKRYGGTEGVTNFINTALTNRKK